MTEAEPRDQRRSDGFHPAFTPPGEQGADRENPFRRLSRQKLVAGLTDPPPARRRVALICGAGLGKTTNLQWLEAAINRHAHHRGKQLAFFLELKDLRHSAEDLLQSLLTRMHNRLGGFSSFRDRLRNDLVRRRQQGRITLLLDSLDQAGPDPEDTAVRALRELLGGVWRDCPIWVSGRPSAFRQNQDLFLEERPAWTYLRVGQFDEPETRFLLDAAHEERQRRRKA